MGVRLLTAKTPAHDKGLIVVDGLYPRIRGLIPGAQQDLVALNHGADTLQRIAKELFTRRLGVIPSTPSISWPTAVQASFSPSAH